MTREKLESLTTEQLETIARKEGILNHQNVSKDELIDLIRDAIEEDKLERRQTNNYAMRLENKKYDILKDEEIEVLQKDEYPLPERYNDTRVVLLIRDPEWAYVYWDINREKLEEIRKSPHYEGFFLRVYEYRGEVLSKETLIDYFDIAVGEEDTSRYINLAGRGNDYRVEIIASVLHKEKSLALSNSIHSPLGYISRNKEEVYNEPDTMMLMLSGLWNYGNEEEKDDNIPQRIISILDSHDFEVDTKK